MDAKDLHKRERVSVYNLLTKRIMKTGRFKDPFFFTTTITKDSIFVEQPTRNGPKIESIKRNEISIIKIKYNNIGLLEPDYWLVLEGKGQICSMPRGGEGERIIFNNFFDRDGFDMENFGKSLEAEENNMEFIIWTKPKVPVKKIGRLESKILTFLILIPTTLKIVWNGAVVCMIFLVFLLELFSLGAAIYGLIIGDYNFSMSYLVCFVLVTIFLVYVRFFSVLKDILKQNKFLK